LRDSEMKYRYMFANHPQPMLIYDLENLSILEVNESAVDKYGYSRNEFLKMNLQDIRPPEDIPAFLDSVVTTRRLNGNSLNESRHLKKNGEILFVEVISHSIRFNGKNARHCLIRDITERKKTEDSLIVSNSLLNAALESTADGILVVDREGKVSRYNQKFVEMWQIPKNLVAERDDHALLNFVIAQLIQPEQFLAKVMELYDKPEESSFDLLELTGGRFFERFSQPQKIGDEIVGRVWSFRDVSKQKHIQNELIRVKEKAEESEKRYKTIIQSQAEGICFVNQDETFEFANSSAERIFETGT
jgi:PAS domain S-box-containing protein